MKVLITRPRLQADSLATALIEAGFKPVFFPVIEIRPLEDLTALDRAIAQLDCYDWLVFTSVNAVEIFLSRSTTLFGKETGAVRTRVAAIGPKTAGALQRRGIPPDFVPKEYIAEAILPGLGDLHGRRVLLPRAEIARKALPEAIMAAGGEAHEIAIYHTLPAQPDAQGLTALRAGVDWVTFTSPSTVGNFCAITRSHGLDPIALPARPRVACIGPITAATAREEGIPVNIVAEEYTTEGLVAALGRFHSEMS